MDKIGEVGIEIRLLVQIMYVFRLIVLVEQLNHAMVCESFLSLGVAQLPELAYDILSYKATMLDN